MSAKRSAVLRIGAMLLAGLCLSLSAAAQTAPAVTRENVEAWLDELVPGALQRGHIAGGVISIVKDGKVLVKKGYGFADTASGRRMDPDQTIIRPGSISKLFTWTSVMQLVEQNRLDLDADINRYLDFRIPTAADRPVTLRHVLTHATGFEEVVKDLLGRAENPDLERYVKTHVPAQLYAPGQVPAYSNYATALAGYVVQRVSGEKFEAYVQNHILGPLGMTSSTFEQPVPADWRPRVATAYRTSEGPLGYYEFVGPSPAGSLASTADDMARFMIAHLQNGAFGDARILADETARAMHAAQVKIYPALNAMALGFYETTRNGHRSIAHNGGTQFFHSDLHLLLDDGIGLFISLNSPGDDAAAIAIHKEVFYGFMDRFFPAPASPVTAIVTARDDAKRVSGYWESSRRHATSWFSVSGLFEPLHVQDEGDGSVSFAVPGRGLLRWTEVEPGLWLAADGKEKMQVLTQDGVPKMFGLGLAPPAAFLPVPWWRSPGWVLPAFGIALAVLLIHGLAGPVRMLLARIRDAAQPPVLLNLLNLLLVFAFAGYVVLLSFLGSDTDRISDRTDWIVICLQAVTLLLLLAAAWRALVSLRSATGRWRTASAFVVLAAIATSWWVAIAFRLVNFNLRY